MPQRKANSSFLVQTGFQAYSTRKSTGFTEKWCAGLSWDYLLKIAIKFNYDHYRNNVVDIGLISTASAPEARVSGMKIMLLDMFEHISQIHNRLYVKSLIS